MKRLGYFLSTGNTAKEAVRDSTPSRRRAIHLGVCSSMMTRTIQFLAIICVAIAMAGGWAHLLELPNKMALSRDDYFTVQQIYRGWALLGIAVIGALVSTSILARPDGRMVHEMYLMQVKSPSESKYPWDYYKVVQKVPGEQAFTTKEESKCALWKSQ